MRRSDITIRSNTSGVGIFLQNTYEVSSIFMQIPDALVIKILNNFFLHLGVLRNSCTMQNKIQRQKQNLTIHSARSIIGEADSCLSFDWTWRCLVGPRKSSSVPIYRGSGHNQTIPVKWLQAIVSWIIIDGKFRCRWGPCSRLQKSSLLLLEPPLLMRQIHEFSQWTVYNPSGSGK